MLRVSTPNRTEPKQTEPSRTETNQPQAESDANIEVFQAFPDGHPRQVIITAKSEAAVELAAAMVGEVRAEEGNYSNIGRRARAPVAPQAGGCCRLACPAAPSFVAFTARPEKKSIQRGAGLVSCGGEHPSRACVRNVRARVLYSHSEKSC